MPAKVLKIEDPEAMNVDAKKLESLFEQTERTVEVDSRCAAQVAVARHGKLVAFRSFGRPTFGGVERDVELHNCVSRVISLLHKHLKTLVSCNWAVLCLHWATCER